MPNNLIAELADLGTFTDGTDLVTTVASKNSSAEPVSTRSSNAPSLRKILQVPSDLDEEDDDLYEEQIEENRNDEPDESTSKPRRAEVMLDEHTRLNEAWNKLASTLDRFKSEIESIRHTFIESREPGSPAAVAEDEKTDGEIEIEVD